MRRFDTIYQDIFVTRTTIDFPNVNSNSTITGDVAVTAPIGTHIITNAPTSDATDLDDMILTWYINAADNFHYSLTNPTGGAIDAGSIDWEFVTGIVNPDIDP